MRLFEDVVWYLILLCTILALSIVAHEEERENEDEGRLLIGAFNIQIFGRTKVSKDDVVAVLCKRQMPQLTIMQIRSAQPINRDLFRSQILNRYDLVGILEIRDSSETAFPELVEKLNQYAGGKVYEFEMGERSGRTSSKEQTGFIYKIDKLELLSIYEWNDPYEDLERNPTVAQFRRKEDTAGRQRKFTFIPIHIKPDDAVAEMNALIQVCEEAERLNGPDIIIAGDLNADCSYVCKSCWGNCKLRTDDSFKWLIDDGVDTTTKKTDCAYDRIILHGGNLVKNSCCAQVYRYDLELQLEQELVEDVSDHYPVEFTLL